MTSTKFQNLSVRSEASPYGWINYNVQKFNDQNSFGHPSTRAGGQVLYNLICLIFPTLRDCPVGTIYL